MPANLDFATAAAAALAGLSAWQAITGYARVQAGQKVLIHGGAGGVGSIAIQIAKHLGAYVAVTVSSDGAAYAKHLGADEVIDYRTQQFDERLQNYDVVLDLVGGDVYRRSFRIIKKGGTIVSLLERPDQTLMDTYGVTAVMMQVRTSIESLNALSELLSGGVVSVHIDRSFPLDKIREAFEVYENDHIHGKVSIMVRPDADADSDPTSPAKHP